MGEVTSFDIASLRNAVNDARKEIGVVEGKVEAVGQMVSVVGAAVKEVNSELVDLRNQFMAFQERQAKDNLLHQAQAEILRIRQELEQNYGNYEIVRNTMVGILQSTDSKIVKENTIARVSEELMIQTPNYWLAPCLVAVAAWIGNDKALAERAIREAVARDEERTALTMALICRRNNRISTCYEWLSIYFSLQDAASFTEGTYTFLDAYINGIFGPDENHVCDDYINKWISEIKASDASFEATQTEIWDKYCLSYYSTTSTKFPILSKTVPEFPMIDNYLGRIDSVGAIEQTFDDIASADVDKNVLAKAIDNELTKLIRRYDREEAPLREEEEYYKAIVETRGDEPKAKALVIERRAKRQEHTVNLLEQMGISIMDSNNVSTSKRKTAVSFLKQYINRGFDRYVTETKDGFPSAITLNINGWSGRMSGNEELAQLMRDYDEAMEREKQSVIDNLEWLKPKKMYIGGIAVGVLAIILFIALGPFLGVVGLIGAGILAFMGWKTQKNNFASSDEIARDYENKKNQGKMLMNATLKEWNRAKEMAAAFEENKRSSLVG